MTTIRVLLLTRDSEYCHRLAPYFGKFHPEIKLTHMNSEQGVAGAFANKLHDVALIDEEFAGAQIVIPSGVAGAYLTESSAGNDINGRGSYCKYRSGEELYRIILTLFADVSTAAPVSDKANKVFAFIGANGGAGATAVAAAFAYRQAAGGKKTLYFCCDQFASCSGFLTDVTESGTMSDLIFIVKTGSKGNVTLKSAALLKKDVSGVRFLENCKDPFDYDGISAENIEKMLEILANADDFDCVVIDGSFYDERFRKLIYKKADRLFIVTENNADANAKLRRLISYLKVTDKRNSSDLAERSMIILNKDQEHDWSGMSFEGVGFCGAVPRYKDKNIRNVANAISLLEIWKTVSL